MAIPYGIYDLRANRGTVIVGTSHDTPLFAVDALCQWWCREGCKRYGDAPELLILADSGGSNSARCRLWKYALQEKLVDPYQLAVTVCHYPTGASKWNPIEHRLFSQIAATWAGHVLSTLLILLNFIRRTTTTTGLKVTATYFEQTYLTGLKVTKAEFKTIQLTRHDICPQWNYTIRPRHQNTE